MIDHAPSDAEGQCPLPMHSPFSATATVSSTSPVGCKRTASPHAHLESACLPARPGCIEGSDGLDRGTAPSARTCRHRCCLASSRSPEETTHLPAPDLANCALPSLAKLRRERWEKGGEVEGHVHVRVRLDVAGCRTTGRPDWLPSPEPERVAGHEHRCLLPIRFIQIESRPLPNGISRTRAQAPFR